MSSRFKFRLIQLFFILLKLPRLLIKRKVKDTAPKRILVIHQLLLGDALMASSLLANLRKEYPEASIDLAAPPYLQGLYASKPYNVSFVSFSPRELKSFFRLLTAETYDHAYLVMDNRYSWTAFAIGAKWIVGYEKGSSYKNLPVNELKPIPDELTSLPDLMSGLAGTNEGKLVFNKKDWPQPPFKPYKQPEYRYAVLHLGASSSLKYWSPQKWFEVANYLSEMGITPVWSAGPGETELIQKTDPEKKYQSFGGLLDLPQLWQLIDKAELIVAPDTGIVHIARHTNTPTVCLFGPGSVDMAGYSHFFPEKYFFPISHDVSCRNQRVLFGRPVSWARQCKRSEKECSHHQECMTSITTSEVIRVCDKIIKSTIEIA